MRGAKCDLCGGLFPRRDMTKVVLPLGHRDQGRAVRRLCPKDWKPLEAAWRQMQSDQLGPRPDPPMPIDIAPAAPRKWRPEEIS